MTPLQSFFAGMATAYHPSLIVLAWVLRGGNKR